MVNAAQTDVSRQDACGIEPRVQGERRCEAAGEQPGPGEQDEGDGHLPGDDRRAQPPACQPGRPSGAGPQRGGHVRRQAEDARDQRHQHCGRQTCHEHGGERMCVERQADSGHIQTARQRESAQTAKGPVGNRNCERHPEAREERALDHDTPGKAEARASEGQAHGQLTTPRLGPDEQQHADRDRSDEQEQADGSDQRARKLREIGPADLRDGRCLDVDELYVLPSIPQAR